jgi:hypothetical protein
LSINRPFNTYVFDTRASAPEPRANSQHNFYSQHRGRSPNYTPYGPLAPVIKSITPRNNANYQLKHPILSVDVYSYQHKLMNVTFRTNASGVWKDIGSNFSVSSGVYSQRAMDINESNMTYWWSVNCSDGLYWTNETYRLATLADGIFIMNPLPLQDDTNVSIFLDAVSFDLLNFNDTLMNVSVETRPDIGSDSMIEVDNGRYIIPVSGLDYLTNYTWFVNASYSSDSEGSVNKSFRFTTLPLLPVITHNFAGNPYQTGGPYYVPGTSHPAADGYYTNASVQIENWMYINCSVTTNTMVDTVWLHWLNETVWTNTSYQLRHTSGDYYEINMSDNISAGFNYSFDIYAVDSLGYSSLYQWMKIGADDIEIDDRRYVQLDGTPENISYSPFYLYPAEYQHVTGYGADHHMFHDDILHHDQGPNGILTNTGYLLSEQPSDIVSSTYATMYLGYWFDETVPTVSDDIENIYFHTWWNASNESMTVAIGKYDGGLYRTNNWIQNYSTSMHNAHSKILYDDKEYHLECALCILVE